MKSHERLVERADLAELGWLSTPDHADKDALTPALAGLIGQAIATRVAQSKAIEEGRGPPLRVTARPVANWI